MEQAVDPRGAHGVGHPVGALLKMVLLALISGVRCIEHRGVYAKENWEGLAEELGFHHWHPPDGETFRLLLSRLDSRLLTRVFENWMKTKALTWRWREKPVEGFLPKGKPLEKGFNF